MYTQEQVDILNADRMAREEILRPLRELRDNWDSGTDREKLEFIKLLIDRSTI